MPCPVSLSLATRLPSASAACDVREDVPRPTRVAESFPDGRHAEKHGHMQVIFLSVLLTHDTHLHYQADRHANAVAALFESSLYGVVVW